MSVKYLLLFPAFLGILKAQQIRFNIQASDHPRQIETLRFKKNLNTRAEAMEQSKDILGLLHERGYLLASLDSMRVDSPQFNFFVTVGDLYRSARLSQGNLPAEVASKSGLSEKLFTGKPFRYGEVSRALEKVISYYENHGYPFVKVKLDSVIQDGDQIRATIHVQPNRFFKLDSIVVYGNARVNKKFINRYLGLREGMPYNEALIASVSQKIRQLAFVIEKQDQRVMLSDKSNKLLLFLDKKNASQFDGIIGLLPDANTGKTVVTGDVKIKLVNGIFRNGETFDLQWRRLQSQTQDFNGRLIYPYLFGTPVGTDYSIKLYRRDTTFIDINNNIGLQYYFSGLNNFKVFYRQRSSNLISTSGLEFVRTLPEYADISTKAYGIGISTEKLDYRFNPRKGISLVINAQTGDRQIRKNPKINDAAYDKLLLRSTQYQFDCLSAFYLPLYRQNVLKIGLQAASVFGNSTIFRNELFRIGGLRTLRGFDEESIFASTYVIPTLEYRYLFARNSNIVVFAEGAWYENNSNHAYVSDRPLSFGAGINFETAAGILTLNYAIGNQFNNGFDPRSGKIHFGLIALF